MRTNQILKPVLKCQCKAWLALCQAPQEIVALARVRRPTAGPRSAASGVDDGSSLAAAAALSKWGSISRKRASLLRGVVSLPGPEPAAGGSNSSTNSALPTLANQAR